MPPPPMHIVTSAYRPPVRLNDGLQPRAAEPVNPERLRLYATAALHRGDARQVHFARFCVDHVAEYHVTYIGPRNIGCR